LTNVQFSLEYQIALSTVHQPFLDNECDEKPQPRNIIAEVERNMRVHGFEDAQNAHVSLRGLLLKLGVMPL
jgi:hypothetical protein